MSETKPTAAMPICKRHDFQEVYYGYECKICGQFYAFGCAPWDETDEDTDLEDRQCRMKC